MKKNKMMRLAACLLVMVLLTTSMIAGTFAKYTTTTGSSDSARVANWGFEQPVAMDLGNLFTTVYKADKADVSGDTVESTVDVIAPGTTGSATFTFAYDEAQGTAPEVGYTFTVDAIDESKCHPDIINNANIQWKLDNNEWGTWDQLLASIEGLSGSASGSKYYGPNSLPKAFTTADDTHTVSWQWIFETSDDANKKDTAMGNSNYLADTELVIKITATQID